MAEGAYLCLLMEKEGLSSKLERLLRLELAHAQTSMQTERYPDKYISVWNVIPYMMSVAELTENFRRIEDGQKVVRHTIGFHIGTSAHGPDAYIQAPPGGFVDQTISVSINQDLQGIFGNPETDVLIDVGWIHSERRFRQHYHQARMLMQKLVEVWEPKYGWVMSEGDLGDLQATVARKVLKPWQLYSPTRVVGSWLLDLLGLTREDISTNTAFYDVKFLGSAVWLAGPSGLGNEQPYRYFFPFVRPIPPNLVSAKPDWWMHNIEYQDEALQRILEAHQIAHDEACNKIFGTDSVG